MAPPSNWVGYPHVVATPRRQLRPALRSLAPTLAQEGALWDTGDEVVVGVDEVGRGAWLAPISLGAAVDLKMLTEAERERLYDRAASW